VSVAILIVSPWKTNPNAGRAQQYTKILFFLIKNSKVIFYWIITKVLTLGHKNTQNILYRKALFNLDSLYSPSFSI